VPPFHPYTIFSGIVIIVGRGIMLMLRLRQGISSGCHHATPTHNFFFLIVITGRGITLLLRLIQGIFSGSHHATPTPFFQNCHYRGKGAISFCFELCRVFLQGATMPHLHPFFSELALLCEGCIILLLRISQGTSSGCHHATPTPTFFLNCRYFGKGAL